jgi:two-component system, chemotaxis family, sensor kinase CheA
LASNDRRIRFLVFKAENGQPNAVPLSLVVRLEDIFGRDVEQSQGRCVVQYREKIMHLVTLSGSSPYLQPDEKKPVLVFSDGTDFLGLVVDQIVDIVEQDLDIKLKSNSGDSYGSIVVNGQTTTLVDVDYLIHQSCPQWESMFENTSDHVRQKTTVLLIDESSLYRNLITPFLEIDNFKVLAFETPEKALRYLEDTNEDIKGILVDRDTLGEGIETFAQDVQGRRGETNFPVFLLSGGRSRLDNDMVGTWGYTQSLLKVDRSELLAYLKNYFKLEKEEAA